MKKPGFCFVLLFAFLQLLQAQDSRKLFVVSDVEGSYSALFRLLRAGEVLNEQGRWNFGSGHLVFVGDMVDRGDQVFELLSFIRQMEKEAAKEGGQVHYILGNHEIMNLSGDFRFVHPVYWKDSVTLLKDYQRLFASGSRTGRWLRSKNILEKIGDYLFVHGGIAPAINALPLSIRALNATAKHFYEAAELFERFDEPAARLLFDSEATSPFWFRGYYAPFAAAYHPPVTEQTIDSTLQKFGVRHIVTGHSIVADTVSMHFGGRLFNTDTPHAGAKGEALFIDNGAFYRVNAKGEKHLLYRRNQ